MIGNQSLKPLFDNDLRVQDLFFDPRTDIIYFLKSIKNKKIKFSTRVKRPDVKKARRVANTELLKRLGRKKNRVTPLIADELTLWLKMKESEGLSYDTLNNVRRARLQIEEFWGDKFPHEITRDSLGHWYTFFKEAHPDIKMENAIKYMRNFCVYLAEKTHGDHPLLPAVPTIKDPDYKEIRAHRKKKKEKIFSHDNLTSILKTAESEEHELAALIMYTMATRVTETLSLRFDDEILLDLDPPLYRWTIGQNKADLWGEHALHLVLIPKLTALREQRRKEGTKLLFPQKGDNKKPLWEQQIDWEAWRKRADIGWHWTPHTFRHTALSLLFSDAKNQQAIICKLYRVSLPTAMETYIKPTKEAIVGMRNSIKVEL